MSVRRVVKERAARKALCVAALAVAGALGGCANPAADEALVAQTALIGMPKATLLSCAGVPERQATVDNREFFTYRSSRIVSYPGTPPLGYYGGPWGSPYYGYGYGYGWPSYGYEVNSFDCEATFSLRNGVVERVVYGGASARLSQCYAIVQNCMALIPQQTIKPSP